MNESLFLRWRPDENQQPLNIAFRGRDGESGLQNIFVFFGHPCPIKTYTHTYKEVFGPLCAMAFAWACARDLGRPTTYDKFE